MTLAEAVTLLQEALEGDVGMPDVWTESELEFLLESALAQVNQSRPRSVRDVVTLVADDDQYALTNVFSAHRVDWLDPQGRVIMQMPPRSYEIWGDGVSSAQTLWVANLYARDTYSVRVHGYAPWLWSLTPVTGDSGTDIITVTAHGFANGMSIQFSSITGGTGLLSNTAYYVRDMTTDTFKLAATPSGAAINFTTNITAGVIFQGSVIVFPADVQQMLIAIARAEALRRLVHERARFRQWATSNPRSDVSVTELLSMTNEADFYARELLQKFRIIKKPVLGRR